MKKISFNQNWTCNGSPVTLPHDAMIHEKRVPGHASGSAQAFFPGGSYVYEKTFEKPAAEHVVFQFEGVYKNAKVFINGKEAGGAPYGYIPFFACADELLVDGENTIRVECENNDQPDSRWYTGAGIYRPVWLWTGPKNAIAPEAVKVQTVSIDPAKVRIMTECDSEPVVQILDGDKVVAEGKGHDVELIVPNATAWSENTPKLYTCVVTADCDVAETRFGIRTISWDNKGFYINGKRTLLRGGCAHHDNGILGAATPDEADYRRVKMMKEAGFNAIRSAHNPCSRAMLDACDELGVYMMDESWDMWFHHKNKYDYATHWRKNYLSDLEAMVNRDYNHPSVVMYSIGNEVSEPAKEEGVEKTKEMVAFLREKDGTRPVTGGFNLMIIANAKKGKGVYNEEGGMANDNSKKTEGMNSTMFNMITNMVGTGMNKSANSKAADEATSPCLDALDMAGYNYASGRYPMEGKCHPDRLIYGSETFPQDIAKNWAMVKQYPYLIGDFMWTAWDYLGEVGIGAWAYTKDGTGFNKPYPWLLADTGAMDIVGWQENGAIQTKEVFRFPNGVKEENGHLVWDTEALVNSVKRGIAAVKAEFPEIESLSIDTWGVDYVLLKGEEEVYPVYAYRDSRTEAVIPQVHEKMPFSELYRHTGCQFQPFNTIYQLYDEKVNGRLEGVTDMLMMPEFLMWKLCGVKAREYTNATTMGMVGAQTGEFDMEIVDRLGYPKHLFPKLSQPGTVLGMLRPEIAAAVGGNCKVVLCATHDTGSAVEGIPMEGNHPYISSGTWSLLGVKTPKPITDSGSEAANYSNEGGVGYNRYQKNIMGMWLVNELQRELCPDLKFPEIVKLAEESACDALADANAPELLAPKSMKAAFDKATNNALATVGDYFRCAYRSLAVSYKEALAELEANTGMKYEKIYIVGGGAKNAFLNRLTEETTGKQVIALPIEATALGNLKIQMEVK